MPSRQPQSQAQPKTEPRAKKQTELGNGTIWFMIAVAALYDASQALLDVVGIGWILVPIAYLHFYIWFKMYGINFFSKKRASVLLAGSALEIITAGIIPAMTFTVARIALDYKIKKTVGI